MKLRLFLTLLGLAIVFGGVFGYKAFVSMKVEEAMASRPEPTQTVSTTAAEAQDWQPQIKAVGELSAVQGVAVAPEIGGRVTEVAVESGQEVAEGDVLFRLDDAADRAELRGLEAEARLAEIERDRQLRLRQRDANSQSDVDQAESRLDQARSRAAAQREQVEKKTLRAPFDGRVGIVSIDRGELVDAGQQLVGLQAIAPIHVDFSVPQRRIDDVDVGNTVVVEVDSSTDREFFGTVMAISPEVDDRSRSASIRARLSNDEGRLRPGMFASVAVNLPVQSDVVTLPQTAITYNPYGDFVYVVTEEEGDEGEAVTRVEQRFVRTGQRRGDQVAVREGVEAGEEVVTSGQMKLRDGARIEINNDIQPDNEADPQVGNR